MFSVFLQLKIKDLLELSYTIYPNINPRVFSFKIEVSRFKLD